MDSQSRESDGTFNSGGGARKAQKKNKKWMGNPVNRVWIDVESFYVTGMLYFSKILIWEFKARIDTEAIVENAYPA